MLGGEVLGGFRLLKDGCGGRYEGRVCVKEYVRVSWVGKEITSPLKKILSEKVRGRSFEDVVRYVLGIYSQTNTSGVALKLL